MIPLYKPWLTQEEKNAINLAVDSTWISSKGPYIQKFEEEFAAYIGAKHAVAVNSGTSACHLSLLAAGIRPGDKVIVPNLTYISTANAVRYCGAIPIFVDVDKHTWNIDSASIEVHIRDGVKAIFCVHLLGNPCNYDKLLKIKNKYNLLIIEDACESIGGAIEIPGFREMHGIPIMLKTGNLFDIAAFSFFGNKTITTGEGGMIVTNNPEYYHKAQLLKGQAQTEPYWHCDIGYNYRMTNICAAIGRAQLSRISDILAEKERIAQRYRRNLSGLCTFQELENQRYIHGNWMVAIKIHSPFLERITQTKIFEFRRMFYPVNWMPPYRKSELLPLDQRHSLPNSLEISHSTIMLPSYPTLEDKEIDLICRDIGMAIDKY